MDQSALIDSCGSENRQARCTRARGNHSEFQTYKEHCNVINRQSSSLSYTGCQSSNIVKASCRDVGYRGRNHLHPKMVNDNNRCSIEPEILPGDKSEYFTMTEVSRDTRPHGPNYTTSAAVDYVDSTYPYMYNENNCQSFRNYNTTTSQRWSGNFGSKSLGTYHRNLQPRCGSELMMNNTVYKEKRVVNSGPVLSSASNADADLYISGKGCHKNQRNCTCVSRIRKLSSISSTESHTGIPSLTPNLADKYDNLSDQKYRVNQYESLHNKVQMGEHEAPWYSSYRSCDNFDERLKFNNIESWVVNQNLYLGFDTEEECPELYGCQRGAHTTKYRVTEQKENLQNELNFPKNLVYYDQNIRRDMSLNVSGNGDVKMQQSVNEAVTSLHYPVPDRFNDSIMQYKEIKEEDIKTLMVQSQLSFSLNRKEQNCYPVSIKQKLTNEPVRDSEDSTSKTGGPSPMEKKFVIHRKPALHPYLHVGTTNRELSQSQSKLKEQEKLGLEPLKKKEKSLMKSKETVNIEIENKCDKKSEGLNNYNGISVENTALAVDAHDTSDNESVSSCKSSIVYRNNQVSVNELSSVKHDSRHSRDSKKRKSDDNTISQREKKRLKKDGKSERKSGDGNTKKESHQRIYKCNINKYDSSCNYKQVKENSLHKRNQHGKLVNKSKANPKIESSTSARTDKHQVQSKNRRRTRCKTELKNKFLKFDEEVKKLKRKSSNRLTRGMKQEITKWKEEVKETTKQRLRIENSILKMHSEQSQEEDPEKNPFEMLNSLNDRVALMEESDLEQLMSSSRTNWGDTVTSHSGGVWRRIIPEHR